MPWICKQQDGTDNDELMCGNFIGVFLSEELQRDSNKTTGDQLRRFIHDQEIFQNIRLDSSGEYGVVICAIIKDVKYALKVVTMATTS